MKTSNNPNDNVRHSAFHWLDQKIKKAVERINARLARYSMTSQIVILLLIVVLLAFANAGVLWKAIQGERPMKITIQAIPFSSLKEGKTDSILSREEYNKLLLFNHLLDSLNSDPGSRGIYNELMQQHPGLRDSVNYLLKYYPPQ